MQDATEPKRGGKRGKRGGRGVVTPRIAAVTEVLRIAAPKGSQSRGYEPYQVQDLVLTARVVRYRRERWLTPSGETLVAPLPAGIRGHFGTELRRFVLMQYHAGQSLPPPRARACAQVMWESNCDRDRLVRRGVDVILRTAARRRGRRNGMVARDIRRSAPR